MTAPVIHFKGRQLIVATHRRMSRYTSHPDRVEHSLRDPIRISSGVICKSCDTPIDMNGACQCSN